MTKKKEHKTTSCLKQVIAIPIGGIIFWYLMKYTISWVPSLAELLGSIQPKLIESNTWKIVALITIIVVAFVLYKIKKKLLLLFALIEITGGGWTVWITFTQKFENNLLYALAIGGGISLLVNGFDNIKKHYHITLKEKSTD